MRHASRTNRTRKGCIAIQVQNQLGADAVVATVFSDSNKKYLSTDLMRDESVKAGYLTPDVEFTEFQPMERAF